MKRAFDLAAATLALILLSPVLAVVAVAVRLAMGRPVLFRQVRPGLHGEPFVMFKFRTMRPPSRPGGELDDAEQRVTSIGRFLRRTSLDELPELLNVVRGEMSLVGPRPLLMQYLPLYTAEQARRHLVRPGITGLAQVNGRNALDWERRFELDVYYVDHHNFRLDLKILAATLLHLLGRRGAGAREHAIVAAFAGSPPRAETTGTRAPSRADRPKGRTLGTA